MNETKKQIKKELLTNIRTILTLVLSLIFINQGWSIAEFLWFTKNEKIAWTLDLALYTFLINVIISLCKIITFRLDCEVSILNKKENFSAITVKEANPEKIFIELKLEGKPIKLKNNLEIAFPHWLDIQVTPKPYLTFKENENKYLIDLNYFIDHKQNIKLTEKLTFDIIKSSDEENEEVVEPFIKVSLFKKPFFRFKCKGITIKLR
ncbi:hypothetical protein [Bacillus altitudinis]|uniref:hypothetical protein n=1 Tax=Bacillus altitudinis TaxID=293387 RepID=UPI0024AE80E5|nr:hypothetical protein [Bacillus altitudinis]MDI4570443.1 hypothetical protein [Bacillus altitudinis]MED1533926.1 hypothetical protein [Bacillus altitudinis]